MSDARIRTFFKVSGWLSFYNFQRFIPASSDWCKVIWEPRKLYKHPPVPPVDLSTEEKVAEAFLEKHIQEYAQQLAFYKMGYYIPQSEFPKRKVNYVQEHLTSDYHLHLTKYQEKEIDYIFAFGMVAGLFIGVYAIFNEYRHAQHVKEHGVIEKGGRSYLDRYVTSPVLWDRQGKRTLFDFQGRWKDARARREEGIAKLAEENESS